MSLEKMIIHQPAVVEGNNEFGEGAEIHAFSSVKDIKLGKGAKIFKHVNAYGCEIGDGSKIGAYCEIQSGAKIGKNVVISSHTFICDLVTIDDEAWLGHGIMTINDLYPPSRKRTGTSKHWKPTYIGKGAIIGSNATLFPVRIGEHAIIGAGAVVRKDVPAGQVWAGNPAKYICDVKDLKYEDGKPVFDLTSS